VIALAGTAGTVAVLAASATWRPAAAVPATR
jgi:hypothetical protein